MISLLGIRGGVRRDIHRLADVNSQYDVVVIGGGFYGLVIANYARESLGMASVLVLEREPELMNRASYVNQARVHNGYHYPRSLLTAYRSRLNHPSFVREYAAAVVDDFEHYYAVARSLSKVSARQFEMFSRRIGASLTPAPGSVVRLFSSPLVEAVYTVREPAFDARILRDLVLERITRSGAVDIHTGETATTIESRDDGAIDVHTTRATYTGAKVISATYSGLNALHRASGLPELSLQHEIAEMPLVRLPEPLRKMGFTVMDGPFFSMMPFPDRGVHTLSHVRYTPHHRWKDADGLNDMNPYDVLDSLQEDSRFPSMQADVRRFMPGLALEYVDRLTEVKTVLTKSSTDDSRPILYRADHGIRNYTCIMGGKLDNIYDVLQELTLNYAH